MRIDIRCVVRLADGDAAMSDPAELPALNKTSTHLEAISALAAAIRQMRHFAMQGTANEIAEACAIACRMADELETWEAERSDRAQRAAEPAAPSRVDS